jgi:hypothetical protein
MGLNEFIIKLGNKTWLEILCGFALGLLKGKGGIDDGAVVSGDGSGCQVMGLPLRTEIFTSQTSARPPDPPPSGKDWKPLVGRNDPLGQSF